MPGQGILVASDQARAAFQAPLVIHLDFSLLVQGIEIGWADMQTVADRAACLADLLVDENMRFFLINLKYIQSEFCFNVQGSFSLFS